KTSQPGEHWDRDRGDACGRAPAGDLQYRPPLGDLALERPPGAIRRPGKSGTAAAHHGRVRNVRIPDFSRTRPAARTAEPLVSIALDRRQPLDPASATQHRTDCRNRFSPLFDLALENSRATPDSVRTGRLRSDLAANGAYGGRGRRGAARYPTVAVSSDPDGGGIEPDFQGSGGVRGGAPVRVQLGVDESVLRRSDRERPGDPLDGCNGSASALPRRSAREEDRRRGLGIYRNHEPAERRRAPDVLRRYGQRTGTASAGARSVEYFRRARAGFCVPSAGAGCFGRFGPARELSAGTFDHHRGPQREADV